ncbi:MAG TPA: MotA/TolQ/ExbB proton channel family protein [Planctomycetota bacterium]|nr:MotA/TolQ/ExbB proton channel family protein [Planctomycetota bacterium]
MPRKALQFLVPLGLLLFLAGIAYSQEAAGTTEGSGHGKSWFDLFKTTGFVGILLLLCSMIGTGLLIQYMLSLTEPKLGNPELLTEVEELMTDGNIDDAFTMAEADRSYAGRVLAGAIARSAGGYEEARQGLEETSAVESFRLNAKISLLSLIGNIGPLLGLLGTVTGMISSFQVIETMKAPTPGDLAKGVYESLVNTTIGLFIAIVFLSAYFFMKNKISDITLRINNQISDLLSRTMGSVPAEGSSS